MSEATNETYSEIREEFGIPETWSDDDIQSWMSREVDVDKGVKTADGVFRFDPTRDKRAMNTWSTDELRAFMTGDLDGIPKRLENEIVNEYRRRESVVPAWSNQEVLNHLRMGTIPRKTESGLWLNDVERNRRKAAEWSDEELDAWAQGEIKHGANAKDAQLAHELSRRFSLKPKDTSIKSVMDAYQHRNDPPVGASVEKPAPAPQPTPVAQHGALSEMNLSFIDTQMQRYVDTVAPGKVVGDELGGKAQRELDNLFNYVLRLEGPALPEGLDRIKKVIIAERDGVFSPSNAYRFVNQLKGNRRRQQQHINLIELFLILTDRNAAAKRKQIDIGHMLNGYEPDTVAKLMDYFKHYA